MARFDSAGNLSPRSYDAAIISAVPDSNVSEYVCTENEKDAAHYK